MLRSWSYVGGVVSLVGFGRVGERCRSVVRNGSVQERCQPVVRANLVLVPVAQLDQGWLLFFSVSLLCSPNGSHPQQKFLTSQDKNSPGE